MHTANRRPLLDVLTAIRLGVRVDQAGEALAKNRENHLRTRADLARFYTPDLLAQTLKLAAACRFSLDELRYEYPDELVPASVTPAAYLRRLTEESAAARWPDGCPPRVHDQIEHELALIAELAYEPYFLAVHDFVVARGELSRLVPVENAVMAGRTVIQWDKDDLDTLELLKVDCLAFGMLFAIHRALDLINAFRGTHLSVAAIPAEDPRVYAMIQYGETTGVFQIESRAQMSMLPRLKPACFCDLVIEVEIVRPGPIQGDMVHSYLRADRGWSR